MSTFTWFDTREAAEKFAEQQRQAHSHVNGIEPSTYGYGENAMHGFLVEMFRGLVIRESECNGYHDSDFFAHWFDPKTGEHGSYMFGSTRGWTYANGCTVDASAEVREAHDKWRDRAKERSRKLRAEREQAALAKIPAKGSTVRVTSKRSKVPHGVEGDVFYFGESGYARPRSHSLDWMTEAEDIASDLGRYRVGIRTSSGEKHFCAATCVTVLKPADELEG